MAAEKGRLFSIKRGDGATSEAFTTIAALRSSSISINGEMVDITNKDSSGERLLLAAAGTVSVTVSGSGVFTDTATELLLSVSALTRTLDNYEILFESGDKYGGAFQITTLEYAGEFNGERTYSVTLESSGTVTFTAV